jgi:hypothetical protein
MECNVPAISLDACRFGHTDATAMIETHGAHRPSGRRTGCGRLPAQRAEVPRHRAHIRHFFQRGEVTQQELFTLHGIVIGLALGRRTRRRDKGES